MVFGGIYVPIGQVRVCSMGIIHTFAHIDASQHCGVVQVGEVDSDFRIGQM